MSTKSVLLSMFEADIEIATGNDKEDLQAVRNWISGLRISVTKQSSWHT